MKKTELLQENKDLKEKICKLRKVLSDARKDLAATESNIEGILDETTQ